MKKNLLIILANIAIMLGILVFVVFYAGRDRRADFRARTEGFQNMTVAMERVTANYLEADQRLCSSWTNRINITGMTMEEAVDFVRTSHTSPGRQAT